MRTVTRDQAIALASHERKLSISAILIGGMHVVVATKSAEEAEARGVEFSWLYKAHNGRSVGIPNGPAGR